MADDKKKQIIENIKFIQEQNKLLREENSIINNNIDLQKRKSAENEIQRNNQLILIEKLKLEEEIKKSNIKLSKDEKKEIDNINKSQTSINSSLTNETKLRQNITNTIRNINGQLKIGWQFLQQQDKIIKSTILNLGMSGAKADMMRSSFEQSAGYVARLGGTLEDVQSIMMGYADETGRAVVLSSTMVQNIAAMGKGTGLGVEQMTKLTGMYSMLGVDAKQSMIATQGIVDTTERMGVNTSNVLKSVISNFKKLSTFTFQNGIKSFTQMAISAEKTRVSMSTALNVAEATRGLEQVIDLGANLQIMGGSFAEMDPFQWLYMVRNEPEKLTEKISEMTKGLYTFRKNSEGIMEKFISPADRDRLSSVAKSLGISNEEMFEIAQKKLDIDTLDKQLGNKGLTKTQKELIQGAAMFNSETGKFEAMVAGQMRDVTNLTKAQADAFVIERKTLEDRAKESQTFDEAFKSTINELKSALLPILRGVNSALTEIRSIIEPKVKAISDFMAENPKLLKTAGVLMAAGFLWQKALKPISGGAKGIGGLFSGGSGSTTSSDKNIKKNKKFSKTSGLSKGGGGKAFGTGAGIGAAMVGAGAGIMLAAEGISKLADSMSKLTDKQAETLKDIVSSLTIFTGIAAGLAFAIGALGAVGGSVAGPLLAFGGAIALIGAGIGIAAYGVGQMGEGMSKLVESGKGAGDDMLKLATGVGALSLSMVGFTAGVIGMSVFGGIMNSISKNAPAMAQVGYAFEQINAVMKGNKEDFIAVENAIASISKSNIKGGGMFGELADLLKNPLKVEFATKDVSLNNNITLELDGQKLMNKSYNVDLAIQRHEALKNGKNS